MMSAANLTASADDSSLDNDFFENNLTVSRDDINRNVKDMFDECSRNFKSLKERQNNLDRNLTIISEHCRRSGAVKENSILKLNVGGEDVNIRRKAIQQYGQHHNILSLLLSNPWDHRLQKNHKCRIFLNVDPAWITPIINLMREQSQTDSKDLPIPVISIDHKHGFETVASYYNFGPLRARSLVISSGPSTITCLNTSSSRETLLSFLQLESTEGQHVDINLDLIYRGSRDGYSPQNVQNKCSGRGRNVIVIEDTTGNVFGGYYHNGQERVPDTKSFLFNLKGFAAPQRFMSLGKLHHSWSPYGLSNVINFDQDLLIKKQAHAIHPYISTAIGTNFSTNSKTSLMGFFQDSNTIVKEMEVYRITDHPVVEGEDHFHKKKKVVPEMPSDQLSELGVSSPLHSWILDAVNSSGKKCGDFQSNLLYSSSRDGSTPAQFHAICDGKPLTVCIIKDNRGHTHGCFSDIAWSSTAATVNTAKSFTFSLGGAVASYTKKIRSVVYNGPSHIVNYGADFQINARFELLLIVDGVQVTVSHPAGIQFGRSTLTVVDMAVYEIIPELRKIDHSSMSFDVSGLNKKIVDSTDAAAKHIEKVALEIKGGEEKLLFALLWVEHLSAPSEGRNVKAGRLQEWRAITAQAHKLTTDVSGMQTLKELEGVMARLHITGTDGEGKGEAVDDEVVSYNVGGTIVAVLRSTLVRQAPNSVFASRFSGRWSEQDNDDMEDGYINLVRY
jgi:TLD